MGNIMPQPFRIIDIGKMIYEMRFFIIFLAVLAIMLAVIVVVLIWKKRQNDKITRELRKAEQLQRDLLANVTHDLRTPLTMIKGYAELVRDISGEDKEKREANLGIIIRESNRLSELVDDILVLSKMQADRDKIPKELTNLSEVVRNICADFPNVQTKIDDGLFAYVNKKGIESAIFNLISNANNHGNEIMVKLVNKGEKVRFSVHDNGKGIVDEDLPKIWDRYYSKRINGTGLGLAITKEILQKNGAEFGVKSKVGVGSIFWFEIVSN